MSSKEPESVEEVIGELDELASKSDAVRIRDVLDDFGGRSFGPFLLLPALLEITPIGARSNRRSCTRRSQSCAALPGGSTITAATVSTR